jgi:hypothetical protein
MEHSVNTQYQRGKQFREEAEHERDAPPLPRPQHSQSHMLNMCFRREIESLKRRNCDLDGQLTRPKNEINAMKTIQNRPKDEEPVPEETATMTPLHEIYVNSTKYASVSQKKLRR